MKDKALNAFGIAVLAAATGPLAVAAIEEGVPQVHQDRSFYERKPVDCALGTAGMGLLLAAEALLIARRRREPS
jgi:hypothetical protein